MTSRRQLPFRFRTHGGKRSGAGRKPNGARALVSHLTRPQFTRTLPVHVTMRMASHVYNLRSQRAFAVIGRALLAAAERFGVRIVQFSVQGNHVDLIVEAMAPDALSRAMQGLSVRIAKGLNRMMHRRGRVLADRYHAHPLRTPTEARCAVAYVRSNTRKHAASLGRSFPSVDPFASDGARLALPLPRTWLLRVGASPPRTAPS